MENIEFFHVLIFLYLIFFSYNLFANIKLVRKNNKINLKIKDVLEHIEFNMYSKLDLEFKYDDRYNISFMKSYRAIKDSVINKFENKLNSENWGYKSVLFNSLILRRIDFEVYIKDYKSLSKIFTEDSFMQQLIYLLPKMIDFGLKKYKENYTPFLIDERKMSELFGSEIYKLDSLLIESYKCYSYSDELVREFSKLSDIKFIWLSGKEYEQLHKLLEEFIVSTYDKNIRVRFKNYCITLYNKYRHFYGKHNSLIEFYEKSYLTYTTDILIRNFIIFKNELQFSNDKSEYYNYINLTLELEEDYKNIESNYDYLNKIREYNKIIPTLERKIIE